MLGQRRRRGPAFIQHWMNVPGLLGGQDGQTATSCGLQDPSVKAVQSDLINHVRLMPQTPITAYKVN